MVSAVFEIIETSEGEFILKRSGESGEGLVRISFSKEAANFLGNASVDIARSMIEAGLQEVEAIIDEQMEAEDSPDDSQEDAELDLSDRVLH